MLCARGRSYVLTRGLLPGLAGSVPSTCFSCLPLPCLQAAFNTKWGSFAGGMCGVGIVIIGIDLKQVIIEPQPKLKSFPFYMDQLNDYGHATVAALTLVATGGNYDGVRTTVPARSLAE